MNKRVEIWTDGGCRGNPGPGAWAFVMTSGEATIERLGFDPQTTNNRMELIAVREALRELTDRGDWKTLPIIVSTDSQYVQKGITEWIVAWERNSWRTRANKPVKNLDLWRSIWELAKGLPVRWEWVMGHAGDPMNERCHHMVEQAIERGTGR
jgi:ribonuclease HI